MIFLNLILRDIYSHICSKLFRSRIKKSDAERAIINWGFCFIPSEFQMLCIFHLLSNQWDTWRAVESKDNFCSICHQIWIYFKMMPFICHLRWSELFSLMEDELKKTDNDKTNFYMEKFRRVFSF